jgi:diguanylate cyclase (GGDEF)-like protein
METLKNLILVVDDNLVNIKLIVDYLEHAGFEVMTARDGLDGIEKAKRGKPDLILLDVMMPEIDGFETCRRLKADPETAAIPVLFMTALNDVDNKVKGFEAGGVDYITKPIQVRETVARVKTHLQIAELQNELTRNNIQLKEEVRERKRAEAILQKSNQELSRLAVIDGLTQIANRRRFDQYLAEQWQAAVNEISLIMMDIDFFKRFNDHYGHPAGDDCLQQVARGLAAAITKSTGLVARYGGEEFAVILPETTREEASFIANEIMREIELLKIPHEKSDAGEFISLSVGVSSKAPAPSENPESLIKVADECLYQAKEGGRKRVVVDQRQ